MGETFPSKGASPTKPNCGCSHELPKGPNLVPLSDRLLLSQLVSPQGAGLPLVPLLSSRLNFLQTCPDAARSCQAQGPLAPASSSPLRGTVLSYLWAGPAAQRWMDPSGSGTADPAQELLLEGGLALACGPGQGRGEDGSRFRDNAAIFTTTPSESAALAFKRVHHKYSSSPYFGQETTWR